MKRVTGIGGIFFQAKDPTTLRAWYKTHLGIDVQDWGGAAFPWADANGSPMKGTTIWSIEAADGDHFAPSKAQFMVNYRVEDLHAVDTEFPELRKRFAVTCAAHGRYRGRLIRFDANAGRSYHLTILEPLVLAHNNTAEVFQPIEQRAFAEHAHVKQTVRPQSTRRKPDSPGVAGQVRNHDPTC